MFESQEKSRCLPDQFPAGKKQASTVQPLLLTTITFHDATPLRLSSHDITGGVQYAGNSYLPRIVNKEIAASQALR